MKRLVQIGMTSVFLLAVVSIAAAQQSLQPVVRLGNFTEVANDVFMHIIATIDTRYETMQNRDFEQHVRDRVTGRDPNNTVSQRSDSDALMFQNRFGVEMRYQKNLTMYLLFEHRSFVDGNLIDDTSNDDNPGGTDVFGRAPEGENPGFHTERYWIDYKFAGTPLRMRVGADLWNVDQAGLVGDDDPRFALFGDFGNLDVMAAAVVQFESQRLGLENDNDTIYYTFSAGYDMKPHRFQLDAVYFRDRFQGADLAIPRVNPSSNIGYQGQKTDSVMLSASWSGQVGPIRGLLQVNGVVGRAQGGTAGLPNFPTTVSQRGYDIVAGAAVAYAEVDVGIVKPFVAFIIGTPDSNPNDRELHGFSPAPWADVTQITGTSWFEQLETDTNFAQRDYACPARLQGVRTAANAATGPQAVGARVLGLAGTATARPECSHSNDNPFNNRIGYISHLGMASAYSNPGTLVVAPGVKVFPLRGHELVGFYTYRAMLNSSLVEQAFRVGVDPGFTGKIDLAMVHEFGGTWEWTLNPHFDIRLAGNVAFLGEGFKQIAQMADCSPEQPGFQPCGGKNTALRGELRFRARF